VEDARSCVQAEYDADATTENGARVSGDLSSDLVKAAIGSLARRSEFSPHLLPSFRHF
jgi:hypothetical protein